MTIPSLTHIRTNDVQVATMNSNLMRLFLTRNSTFFTTGHATSPVLRFNSTAAFDSPAKTGIATSTVFKDDVMHTCGSQYDPKSNTFVTCNKGVVTEFLEDETIFRTINWSSVLGTNSNQGVILGYENEEHFYILNKGTNQLFKCNRDFSGVPVYVRNFTTNVNYKSSYTPNGFFNHIYIYLLTYTGGYKIARTDITTGTVTELPLVPSTGTLAGTNVTSISLGLHNGRTVFTLTPFNDSTYPPAYVFDIDDAESMYILIKDGNELKSYSDTGYTRNVCVGGAVISSIGYEPGHPNSDAFDNNPTTYWGSNETGLNVRNTAFIGYDFQTVHRHIRRIEITKAADPAHTPDYLRVQYSNDGAVWSDAASAITLTKDSSVQVIDLPVSASARRWRLVAGEVLATGKTWRVRDIKMYERNPAGWYVVGTHPVIPEVFKANGLSKIDFMSFDIMKLLTYPDLEIQIYVDDLRMQTPTLDMRAIPHPRIVYPKGDIQLASVDKIERFTLTATETGAGVVRVVVSPDEGDNWYTWDGITDTWRTINTEDLYEVKTGGMTASVLNARDSEQWMRFNTEKIRFAYYLEIHEESDVASTELLTVTADMAGIWEKAQDDNYTYGYARNNRLTVRLFSDGDYKINYTTY